MLCVLDFAELVDDQLQVLDINLCKPMILQPSVRPLHLFSGEFIDRTILRPPTLSILSISVVCDCLLVELKLKWITF